MFEMKQTISQLEKENIGLKSQLKDIQSEDKKLEIEDNMSQEGSKSTYEQMKDRVRELIKQEESQEANSLISIADIV